MSKKIKNPKYIYRRIFVRFVSASKKHIEWLQSQVIKNLKVKGRIHTAKPSKEGRANLYVLKFGKKESLTLLSQIYYSPKIPLLKRKRVVYKKFLKNA